MVSGFLSGLWSTDTRGPLLLSNLQTSRTRSHSIRTITFFVQSKHNHNEVLPFTFVSILVTFFITNIPLIATKWFLIKLRPFEPIPERITGLRQLFRSGPRFEATDDFMMQFVLRLACSFCLKGKLDSFLSLFFFSTTIFSRLKQRCLIAFFFF